MCACPRRTPLSPSFPFVAPRSTTGALRAWQQTALDAYLAKSPRDFLAVATPGAGKTTFALRVASELIAAGVVQAVTVVTPTEHSSTSGPRRPTRPGSRSTPPSATGRAPHPATTPASRSPTQVAAHPALHLQRTAARRTLVILDEIHNGGDALSWGDAVREAFTPATRRLGLTGTPFRSDTSPFPFVTYAPMSDGITRSVADYVYGYGQALRDRVVRASGSRRSPGGRGDETARQITPLRNSL
jgi:superfamily II DNA or RNA helicase